MKDWKTKLSKREREVCELVLKDFSNKEIAEKLGINERTVEVHRATIYNKLQVPSQKETLKAICI